MKRFLLTLTAFALGVGILALALRPTAISQYRLWREARVVRAYRRAAGALDTLECGTRLAGARQYNDTLKRVPLTDVFSGLTPPEQDGADGLDLNGDGVIAILEIPKLGASMPVYRDASPETLAFGAGHLAGTSLPVGGAGAHSVLAGQQGGQLSGLFTGLDRLIPGDCFYVQAMQDRLVYEVQAVWTAEPGEAGEAALEPEEDACTLMTDASDGNRPLRLFVRGRRVSRRETPLADDTGPVPDWAALLIFAAPFAAAGLLLLGLIESIRRAAGRRRIRRRKI